MIVYFSLYPTDKSEILNLAGCASHNFTCHIGYLLLTFNWESTVYSKHITIGWVSYLTLFLSSSDSVH